MAKEKIALLGYLRKVEKQWRGILSWGHSSPVFQILNWVSYNQEITFQNDSDMARAIPFA